MTDDELIAKAEKELASLTRCMSPDKVAKLEAHRLIALARIGAGELVRERSGWQPIANLTKKHLPALIKGGTYDWSDNWSNSFIPYTGVSITHCMPDKRQDGAMKGDQYEGHDNYFWHKPEWFFPLATLDAAPASPMVEDVVKRMVRAFKAVLLDIDFLIERGHLTDIRNDMIYTEARAALAAIRRT